MFKLPSVGVNSKLSVKQQSPFYNVMEERKGIVREFTSGAKKVYKTYEFQEKLPRLPVAELQPSINKWLHTVKPFLTAEEFEKTKALAADFGKPGGQGEKLRNLLVERAKVSKMHWLAEWWDSLAYMAPREPIALLVNYYFNYDFFKPNEVSQGHRAAQLTVAALKFKQALETQELTPDMGRDQPNDMEAYKYMFNYCRIPHKPEDYLQGYDPKEARHIVVAYRNNFYVFDVISPSGEIYPLEKIEAAFDAIKSQCKDTGVPFGVFTADHRDVWTDARTQFLKISPKNAESLKKLESSCFMVCLDETKPEALEDIGRGIWHGNGANRWFDKSIQFIVFENAVCGLNGEHSKLDGIPVGRLADFIFDTVPKLKPASNLASYPTLTPAKLDFVFDKPFLAAVEKSVVDFKKFSGSFDHRVLHYKNYGKNLIKKLGVSPDAFVQMSLQLTYYKLYGKFVAVYESGATKKYLGGRTEVVRAVSPASCDWVLSMTSKKTSCTPQQQWQLFKTACESHVNYMKDSVEGKGCDRLFLGMRLIAKEHNLPVHDIYSDKAFSLSNHWAISTSQMSSEGFYVGFGQVVDDGYGICYCIRDNMISYTISCYKNGPVNADKFHVALQETLKEMKELGESNWIPKAKI